MKVLTQIAAVALVVGALGTLAWWGLGGSEPSPRVERGPGLRDASAPESLHCRFQPGKRHAYRFRLHSDARMNPSALVPGGGGAAQGSMRQRDVEGVFLWRVLANSDGESTLAAVFHTFQAGDRHQKAGGDVAVLETHPVLLRIDDRCRFGGVGAEAGTPPVVVRQWQLITSLFEVVGPADEVARTWMVRQDDPTGTYSASYKVDDDVIVKRRQSYLDVRSPGQVELVAHVLASEAKAWSQPGSPWLTRADVGEDIELRTRSGVLFVRAETRADVERLETLPDDPFWEQALDVSSFEWRAKGDYAQDLGRMPSAQPEPGLASWSPTEALAAFRRRLEDASGIGDAVEMLAAYLRADDAHAREIYQLLIDGQFADDERSVVFLALEQAGGTACRDVLIDAINNPRLSSADHLRAFSALADVPAPDDTVVDAVVDAARGPSTHQGRAAMLALGTLAGREELDRGSHARVVERVRDGLHGHASRDERLVALDAVGNAGSAGLEPFERRVREIASADDPRERAAAHDALRRIEARVDHLALLDDLVSEGSRTVRQAIGERLTAAAGAASPAATRRAARLLEATRPLDVRRTLIEYLGVNADGDPVARDALIEHFRFERRPELLVLIGRYISADELGAR